MRFLFLLFFCCFLGMPEAYAQSIDLGAKKITDWPAFYAYVDAHPQITELDMFATPVDKTKVAELVARYPHIRFGWTLRMAEHTVRTDAEAFSTLHHTEATVHTNEELSLLRYCTRLYALDIGHNAVSDLSFLYHLPLLRVLIVACNEIEDITPLASLYNLEYVELFSNRIVDISPLQNLPYLAHLNLSYNQIETLEPLHHMPQLRRLWLKHACSSEENITGETVMQLRHALPHCHINHIDEPTAGGWRESEEYDIFYSYFRTGAYIPFPNSPNPWVVVEGN